MATRKPRTVSDAPAPTPAEPVPTSTRRSSGPSVNSVALVGRLTVDPDLRYTSTGKAVTRMRLATNNSNGTADFHTIEVWERLAETAAQYLTKGRLIHVAGTLRTKSWDAPDGTKRSRVVVVGRTVTFLGGGTPPAAAS
jgi:single-strand DNA-binding protein